MDHQRQKQGVAVEEGVEEAHRKAAVVGGDLEGHGCKQEAVAAVGVEEVDAEAAVVVGTNLHLGRSNRDQWGHPPTQELGAEAGEWAAVVATPV